VKYVLYCIALLAYLHRNITLELQGLKFEVRLDFYLDVGKYNVYEQEVSILWLEEYLWLVAGLWSSLSGFPLKQWFPS
jgi:hypothetical protein